jgi:hypothetical protein
MSIHQYNPNYADRKTNKDSTGLRQSGRTTRIVDDLVQELFSTGQTIVIDHFGSGNADRIALDILKKRLFYEHGLLQDVHYRTTYLRGNFLIKLRKRY